MKRFTTVRVFFIAVSLLNLALGCTRPNLPESTLESNTRMTSTPTYIVAVTSDPDPLNGTDWELVAFESEEKALSIPKQPQFFVEFQKGELNLRGGCNSIGGHYVLEGSSITITFAKGTDMDCSHLGPDVNDVERTFVAAMQTFDSYTLEGEQLRISYIDGELLFRRVSD